MNKGVLEINLGVLRSLLKLPEGTRLLRVRQSWEQEHAGSFEVLVESPELTETLPGHKYPWIRCMIYTEFCSQDEVTHITKSELSN